MTHKIIQWNCRGYKANYDELLLLIAEPNPTTISLHETFKKHSDKQNIKPLNNMTTYMISDKELQVEYQS